MLTEQFRRNDLDILSRILRDAHRRLDERGVPPAHAIPRNLPRISILPSDIPDIPTEPAQVVPRLTVVSRTGPISPVGDWAELAACKGQTMFYEQFPAVSHRPTKSDRLMEAQALASCNACPVLEPCRAWALQPVEPATDHVAGGLTPRQRHEIRRHRDRVNRGRRWL